MSFTLTVENNFEFVKEFCLIYLFISLLYMFQAPCAYHQEKFAVSVQH